MAIATGERKSRIEDTDMGSDNWLAALLLPGHPAVDFKATTVTETG
jgi:inosine-uridine nucleoside N-ribohydrolase